MKRNTRGRCEAARGCQQRLIWGKRGLWTGASERQGSDSGLTCDEKRKEVDAQ